MRYVNLAEIAEDVAKMHLRPAENVAKIHFMAQEGVLKEYKLVLLEKCQFGWNCRKCGQNAFKAQEGVKRGWNWFSMRYVSFMRNFK